MDQNTSENESKCRSGIDRRQLSFTVHIPERRSGKERRRGMQKEAGTQDSQEQMFQEPGSFS